MLSIGASIIMPDHLHFILNVNDILPKNIGDYIAGFKGACSRAWWSLNGLTEKKPLFSKGFHDRIIRDDSHRNTAIRYIYDNPRRLMIKHRFPDLFRRYNHLRIGSRDFAAYGNVFLLRDFDKNNVVIHRADSFESRKENRRRWLGYAANGGVLISPFISKDEKEIRDEALKTGGRLVILKNEGFEERFKPLGREFNLCLEGRLLLLAPWPENLTHKVVTRLQALEMNRLAEILSKPDISISILSK